MNCVCMYLSSRISLNLTLNWCICECVWSENTHVKRNVEKFQNWFFFSANAKYLLLLNGKQKKRNILDTSSREKSSKINYTYTSINIDSYGYSNRSVCIQTEKERERCIQNRLSMYWLKGNKIPMLQTIL